LGTTEEAPGLMIATCVMMICGGTAGGLDCVSAAEAKNADSKSAAKKDET